MKRVNLSLPSPSESDAVEGWTADTKFLGKVCNRFALEAERGNTVLKEHLAQSDLQVIIDILEEATFWYEPVTGESPKE